MPPVSLDAPVRQQIIEIVRQLPKLELPVFDGQPKNWPMWWNMFQNSVHSIQLDEFEKLAILCERLDARVKRSMASFLYNPKLYEKPIEMLRRYGSDDVIVDAVYESVKKPFYLDGE